MKRFFALLVLGTLLFVMGCSSVSVDYDYDRQTDFSKLKSYAWLAQSFNATSTTARQAQQQNSLFYKENTRMLFGDAKSSIEAVISQFKAV